MMINATASSFLVDTVPLAVIVLKGTKWKKNLSSLQHNFLRTFTNKNFAGLWRRITRCVQYVEDSFTK